MAVNDPQIPWHSQTIESVAAGLKTRLDTGLSSAEADERLQRYGSNELRVVTEDDGSPFPPNEKGYGVCVKGAPGLPTRPVFFDVDLNLQTGKVVGLFQSLDTDSH